MAKFKNVSPLGALDIPAVGRVIAAGETFEVPGTIAGYFAAQPANFKPVKGGSDKPVEPPAEPGETETTKEVQQ